MNSTKTQVAIGISQPYQCNYLPDQQEQLLIIQEAVDDTIFERLLALGFRRSGNAIYKPRCPSCSACLPVRVPVNELKLSKSQKRTLSRNKDLHWRVTEQVEESHYPLYEKYIRLRHFDGPMFPASEEQFAQFLTCNWMQPRYIELFNKEKLIAVAVTDYLPNSLSAIYTYFDPDEEKRSLGNLMVLLQCRLAKLLDKEFLYLGYQIDANVKMCYKRRYQPYQLLTGQGWQYGS
ncbi:arginyltransferase [Shewanella submarina]|uniref:Aspartate/glutamate leucyltransferase n=1 Tax=Shewanella submarina TaxID=2016376 RepID=A0ABV7GDD1_9GAMM|nr:arginyltransferase [Shewanella submarina]MCL1037549.1 arginyltransferase [Shewanella submarina]